MFNQIKETLSKSVSVEVKAPVYRNQKPKHPVIVTDLSQSVTSGWSLTYLPQLFDGNRLYNGSETFDSLSISQFNTIHQIILSAHHYFMTGQQVTDISNNRKRAIYELQGLRVTVTSQTNSVSVVLSVTDETSPFHMLSVAFTVTPNKNAPGSFYVIGSDKSWNKETDTFETYEGYFASPKRRFIRVNNNNNTPTIKAGFTGQLPDSSLIVDVNKTNLEYIQVISSKYRALAYIVEQELMEFAFARALEQGVQATAPQMVQTNASFIPAFTLPGASLVNNQPPVNQAPPVQQTGYNPMMQQQMQQAPPPVPFAPVGFPGAPAPLEATDPKLVASLISGQ